ncbi:unnamed protein product [Phyllotreta striolata]|uniref:Peptidase S1 domain-containing protein n=1 Tax=Phyllotreta striolata TaxID=444603 RepID=A0A9N9TYC2_PHYSR|nr:unnamed protein product [Phyllotreta striolata]
MKIQNSNMHLVKIFILACIVCSLGSANEDEVENDTLKDYKTVYEGFHQVSIHLSYNDDFLCGGAIVSPNTVVTVAHCLYYSWGGIIPPLILAIKAGNSDLKSQNIQSYSVSKVTFHDKFDAVSMKYDLAALQVSTPFPLENSAIGIIPVAKDTSKFYSNCLVYGWTEDTNTLQYLDARLTVCTLVNEGRICVDARNSSYVLGGLCQYAPGSSLVCDNKLIGILFSKPLCNGTETTVFENARYILDFSDEISYSASPAVIPVESNQFLNLLLALLSFVLNFLF